jgi:hypothetical protein
LLVSERVLGRNPLGVDLSFLLDQLVGAYNTQTSQGFIPYFGRDTPRTLKMTTAQAPAELFAVDFAALAREIAMDIFPIDQILELHQLTDLDWQRIQDNPKFQSTLKQLVGEWNATTSTRDRVKINAATGLESVLEVYIRDINDGSIPLAQRVEAGKFLARLGELDGQLVGSAGGGFSIVLNIGEVTRAVDFGQGARIIETQAIPE